MELPLDRARCNSFCSLVSISQSANDSSFISALSQKKHVTKFLTHFKIFLPSLKVGQNSPFIRQCNYFLKRSYLKGRGILCYIKGCKLSGLEKSSHCEVLKNNKDPSLFMRFGVVVMKVKGGLIQNLLQNGSIMASFQYIYLSLAVCRAMHAFFISRTANQLKICGKFVMKN